MGKDCGSDYDCMRKNITLYFKVSLFQCGTFKYWVLLINYMYLLYG